MYWRRNDFQASSTLVDFMSCPLQVKFLFFDQYRSRSQSPPHPTPPQISLGTSYSENYRTLNACKVKDIICIGDDNSPYRTYLPTFHNTPLTVYIEIRFYGGLLIN